jgi:hypothetical protein
MKEIGGLKTRIILSIWIRNQPGEEKDTFTTDSGETAIRMSLKNTNVAIARAAGNICANICANGGKRDESC